MSLKYEYNIGIEKLNSSRHNERVPFGSNNQDMLEFFSIVSEV